MRVNEKTVDFGGWEVGNIWKELEESNMLYEKIYYIRRKVLGSKLHRLCDSIPKNDQNRYIHSDLSWVVRNSGGTCVENSDGEGIQLPFRRDETVLQQTVSVAPRI